MEKLSSRLERLSKIDSILSEAEKLKRKYSLIPSLKLYNKALKEYEKLNDILGIYNCLRSLGDIYRMTGEFDLSEKYYGKAINLAQKMGSEIKMADAKVGLGLSLRAKGNWKGALELIHESKEIYKKKDDIEGFAFSMWAEAGALRIKGDIRKAIEIFKEALFAYKMLNNSEGMGYCLCGLGGASRVAGLLKTSLNYYKKANKIFTFLKDTFGRAYSFCGIGNAYRMLKNYREALKNFSKATMLYEKIGDRVSYAYTIWGLSTTYKMMGDYKSARHYLLSALKLFKKTKDSRGIIYCKLGLGEIEFLKGKNSNALKHILYAKNESQKNNFALEKCHAETLLSFVYEGISLSLLGEVSRSRFFRRKINNKCYNHLGLKFKIEGLPLNIP